jgi:superfamily II DNA or RNA helicase
MEQPKHPEARRFVHAGLFETLTSFDEFERRVAGLATAKERGDAFEVFAEAYLSTQRSTQAKNVWPLAVLPHKVKQQLALDTRRDMGVDGVMETVTGEYHAYQVKFRAGREPLKWAELSTFMGLADQVQQRVLFTNCDALPPVINQRRGFYPICGHDLDELDERDFRVVHDWLQGTPQPRERKSPQEHQQEAVSEILAALRGQDRATALMACGTGKTLVALWVAEQLQPRTVLVLVPSLALLRQTLNEWLRETHWNPLSYLSVCSDATVQEGLDDLVIHQSDVNFPVTTDCQAVKRFLAVDGDAVKIVFSTYQSAREVAKGMLGVGGERFDVGIFDEAHKTAGREGTNFAFALKDSNLPIAKRLFLTATPRHYDVARRDKDGDAKLVYSMDVPDTYGPVAYRLPFSTAARRGIICHYKVVISVVTSKMVTEEFLRRGEVVVDGATVRARQVANQLALQQAVTQHDIEKVFTFHARVKSAAAFAGDGPEGIRQHLSNFESYYVSGAMPTYEREGRMNDFRRANEAVMSNARCLTEGVDVPAVDMVALMAPRRSRVDIVQAVGRAIRKNPGTAKVTGYVLVPLYVQESLGESIEAAVARTEFGDVWAVLQAMQEHDEVLGEIIQRIRRERGKTRGYDDSRISELVETIGPKEVSVEALRDAITTRCLERLGSSWDDFYGKLQNFRERFGHCHVSIPCSEDPQLGTWVGNQRATRKRGDLRSDRVTLLDQLGFVWDARDAYWETMFAELQCYRERCGPCNVSHRENRELATWVATQRQARTKGELSEERTERLNAVGFSWAPLSETWETMFNALLEYRQRYGDCDVPAKWPENEDLGAWVGRQRTSKKSGQMSADRVRRLEGVGLVWEPHWDAWEQMFRALSAYKNTHEDCNVPDKWAENSELARWVGKQRQLKRKGKLSKDRLARLDEIGFFWDPRDAAWEQMFRVLLVYKTAHGDCNVPDKWPEDRKLATWVGEQRQTRRNRELSEERIGRLETIGLCWNRRDAQWDQMFKALKDYKAIHGHCNVPRTYSENSGLALWVGGQRTMKNAGRLLPNRVHALDEIGFVWDPREAQWLEMYAALVAFQKAHGHCNVPIGWSANPLLGRWVSGQRIAKKSRKLSDERAQRLEKIGLVWDPHDVKWEEMISALLAFKQAHGHCRVPANWRQNRELARWFGKQRQLRNSGRLRKDRLERLESIGFVWEVKPRRRAPRSSMLWPRA